VHPAVRKKYEENDFDVGLERAEDVNEKAFLEQVKASQKPVKHEIVKIVRLKKGKQEHFYYYEELTSTNYLGNKIHHYQVQGKYEDPQFRNQINEQGQKQATEIEGRETVYEYKWPDQWSDDLEQLVVENVDKERSFEDLITFGKKGTFDPEPEPDIKKKPK